MSFEDGNEFGDSEKEKRNVFENHCCVCDMRAFGFPESGVGKSFCPACFLSLAIGDPRVLGTVTWNSAR